MFVKANLDFLCERRYCKSRSDHGKINVGSSALHSTRDLTAGSFGSIFQPRAPTLAGNAQVPHGFTAEGPFHGLSGTTVKAFQNEASKTGFVRLGEFQFVRAFAALPVSHPRIPREFLNMAVSTG